MRILKLILMIVGIALVLIGLYNAFIPQEVLKIGPLEISDKEGISNQTLGMIGLGVFAILAAILAKKPS